jgi:hypothetical protein
MDTKKGFQVADYLKLNYNSFLNSLSIPKSPNLYFKQLETVKVKETLE